jgi:pilus assembly protein CpaE
MNAFTEHMSTVGIARNWKILVLGPSAELGAAMRALLSEQVPSAQLFEVRSYPDTAALGRLLSSQPLSVCLLDATSSKDTALPLIREIEKAAPKLPVVTLLSRNDPDLVLACLRQGAAEFLIHPFLADQVGAVFGRLATTHPNLSQPDSQGRLVAVLPVKGGCGASTLALNLAYQRKKFDAKRVLLADLDPLCGIQSFLLKAKPAYSFMDAIARGSLLDGDVWRGLVQTVDGVDVLYAPDALVEGIYDLVEPRDLITFARGMYELVVADAASVYGPWNERIAQMADDVLLITSGEPAAVPSCRRALEHLRNLRVPAQRIKLVLNRDGKSSAAELLQQQLAVPVYKALPSDPEAVQQSLLDGKPVAAASGFGKSLGSLATALAGKPSEAAIAAKPPEKAKSGGLAGLWGLLGRK